MAHLQTSTDYSVDMPSTSASTNHSNRYHDVFINHRGPDIKKTFAHRLYHRLLSHRLQPFLDKDELHKGEYIDRQIKDAIGTASVHITIFSPGYADSIWCLDELLLIWNKSKSGDIIIPVFYNVKPSELRWTKGRYAEALSKHEQKGRCNNQTLENWKNALKEVSNIVGFELEAYDNDEDKLLEEVVGCVLEKRRKTPLIVADYPTGLQVKVEDFEKTVLAQQQRNRKARVLGIVGLGGVGKTTLAKELFNRKSCNFNKSSFLYDVRESVRLRSLNTLQSTLLKGLTGRTDQIDSIGAGIDLLRKNFSSLHALIVLDDVDDANQLQAVLPIADVLHSDSLILVTSRYKDVLTKSGIAESSMYQLSGLNDQHSQQLFCSHAFFQPDPLPGFDNLVDEFCKACHGLPLSLRVFGALLCEKNDQSYWEGQLDILRQTELPEDILKSLKISYDALHEKERQIFLDISCYFIGEDKDMAVRIWDGSGWHGLVGLRNLQDKCLVEVDKNNTLKMHDHLRDLGRQIADQEKSYGVIPHRLWRQVEDISELWQNSSMRGFRTLRKSKEGWEASEKGSESEEEWEIAEDINELWQNLSMGGFRTLRKSEEGWEASEEGSESEEWEPSEEGSEESEEGSSSLISRCEPSRYRFSNLQLVDTEGHALESIVRESILRSVEPPNLIWLRCKNYPYTYLHPWIRMKNIRVLEVSGANLNTLWEAKSQAPLELRELNIYSPLLKFPNSIGQLRHIQKIVVRHSKLKSLTEQFCLLRSLKYLDLSSSRLLQMLPDSFECLTNLQHLDLSSSELLEMLPNSFGCLNNLQHLNLSSSKLLKMLPNSFGRLTNLQYLDLSRSQLLQTLPNSFGCLTNLQYLNLSRSQLLQMLPNSFGCLTNLQHLDLSFSSNLQMLPNSFGNLVRLEHLDLLNCSKLTMSDETFANIRSLKYLNLSGCTGVEVLPLHVAHQPSLEKLYLVNTHLQELPGDIGNLSSLELFRVGSPFLEILPGSLGHLSRLKDLVLYKCDKLKSLPRSLGHLSRLKDLVLYKCDKLKSLPDSLGQLAQLSELIIYGCEIKFLQPEVVTLNNLLKLTVEKCPMRELPFKKEVEGGSAAIELSRLEYLYLSDTKISEVSFIDGVGPTLKDLIIDYCNDLVEVGALPRTLINLSLQNCPKLRKIEGLCNLTNLQELDISLCKKVEDLPGLERLTSLKNFTAMGCLKLKRVKGLGPTQLQYLNVSHCYALEELEGVEDLMSLKRLHICKCTKLRWVGGVLEQLREQLGEGLMEIGIEGFSKHGGTLDYSTGLMEATGGGVLFLRPDYSFDDSM